MQERLLEALAVRAGGGKEQIFALPFVLADGLYACWLRFAFVGDGRDGDETHGERNETPPLSIELEIPTLTLGGVVGGCA